MNIITTREVYQRAVDLLEHTGLMGADKDSDDPDEVKDWEAAQLLQQICDSHSALLADARAMRELVRRALDDRLKVVVSSPGDEYFLLCDCCDNYVVVTGYARATAHPYRGVCTCAPGVSWVRDAIAAGLHNERKP